MAKKILPINFEQEVEEENKIQEEKNKLRAIIATKKGERTQLLEKKEECLEIRREIRQALLELENSKIDIVEAKNQLEQVYSDTKSYKYINEIDDKKREIEDEIARLNNIHLTKVETSITALTEKIQQLDEYIKSLENRLNNL